MDNSDLSYKLFIYTVTQQLARIRRTRRVGSSEIAENLVICNSCKQLLVLTAEIIFRRQKVNNSWKMGYFPTSPIYGVPKSPPFWWPARHRYCIATCYNYLFNRLHKAFTIRYDTRRYFNVRSKAHISQLNLPHGTDNLKSVKQKKVKSKKTDMLRSNSKQSGKSI